MCNLFLLLFYSLQYIYIFEIGHFIDKYTFVHCSFCVNGKEAMQWEELRVVLLCGIGCRRLHDVYCMTCLFYNFFAYFDVAVNCFEGFSYVQLDVLMDFYDAKHYPPLAPSLILSRSIKAFHWRWPPKHIIQCPAMHCSRSESCAFLPLTRTFWRLLVYLLTSLCLTPRCFSSCYLHCRVLFTHILPYTTFFLNGCHISSFCLKSNPKIPYLVWTPINLTQARLWDIEVYSVI